MFEDIINSSPKWIVSEIAAGLEDTISQLKEIAQKHDWVIGITATPEGSSAIDKANYKANRNLFLYNNAVLNGVKHPIEDRNGNVAYIYVPDPYDVNIYIETIQHPDVSAIPILGTPEEEVVIETALAKLQDVSRAHSCALKIIMGSCMEKQCTQVELAVLNPHWRTIYLLSNIVHEDSTTTEYIRFEIDSEQGPFFADLQRIQKKNSNLQERVILQSADEDFEPNTTMPHSLCIIKKADGLHSKAEDAW